MENIDEDIKIVEEKIKQWEPYKNIKFSTEIEKELARENQAIENLLSRLKTAERMNDVLAEQNVKSCEWYYSEFDNYTKDDFIEWARKKVEDDSSSSNEN